MCILKGKFVTFEFLPLKVHNYEAIKLKPNLVNVFYEEISRQRGFFDFGQFKVTF